MQRVQSICLHSQNLLVYAASHLCWKTVHGRRNTDRKWNSWMPAENSGLSKTLEPWSLPEANCRSSYVLGWLDVCKHLGKKSPSKILSVNLIHNLVPLEVRLHWWTSLASREHRSGAHFRKLDHTLKPTVTPVLRLTCQKCEHVLGSKDCYNHNHLPSFLLPVAKGNILQGTLPEVNKLKQFYMLNSLRIYLPGPVERGLHTSSFLWALDHNCGLSDHGPLSAKEEV